MTQPFTCPTQHHPHRELMDSPRVSPTPLGSPPPRVHTTTIIPTSHSTLPTHAPTNVQISMFPPDVPRVEPRQSNERRQLGTAPRLPTTTSSISHLKIPTPTTPITCKITPHVSSPPLTKLWQPQRVADLGILDDKVYLVNGPAHNTCSKTQVCTITQEALLSCTHNYGKATNHPVMACHTAQ